MQSVLFRVLTAAGFLMAPVVGSAAPFTSVVNAGAGTGAERCATGGADTGGKPGTQAVAQNGGVCAAGGAYGGLTSIAQLYANSQGATLTRVSDVADTIWSALPGAGVFGIGRSASNSFTLGYLPGASGPFSSFVQLAPVLGSPTAPALYLPSAFIAGLSAAEKAPGDIQTSATAGAGAYNPDGTPTFQALSVAGAFRFAIHGITVTRDWSTAPSDNALYEGGALTTDHAVTWQLSSAALAAQNKTQYLVSFENAPFASGGDGDFNDYTFVFQNVLAIGGQTGSQAAVPEPASLAMLAVGLLGIVAVRRWVA